MKTPLQEKYETLVQAAEKFKANKTTANGNVLDAAAVRFVLECQNTAFNCLTSEEEGKIYEALRTVLWWGSGRVEQGDLSGFKPIYERLRGAEDAMAVALEA